MHAGGGALAGLSADDWQKDKDKEKESGSGSNDDREKPDSWKHEKPEGGVHAGGGALAGVSADDWEKDKESGSGSSATARRPGSTRSPRVASTPAVERWRSPAAAWPPARC